MSVPDKKFILVEQSAAPEFLVKVLKAKDLIKLGKAKSSTEACKMADVSRTTYYKYKDSVYSYEEDKTGKILTLYFSLCDKPGILSSVISELYKHSANIITVNQNIPAGGTAAVTISLRIDGKKPDTNKILESLKRLDGVIEANLI